MGVIRSVLQAAGAEGNDKRSSDLPASLFDELDQVVHDRVSFVGFHHEGAAVSREQGASLVCGVGLVPAVGIDRDVAKRVKRVAFGFRSFANFRVRALLYAGRPDWALLASITP